MEKQSIYKRFKQLLASIGWKLFIWGNEYTEEEYWQSIYEQELNYKNSVMLDDFERNLF